MGAYKTTASAKIHAVGNPEFCWQRSYNDQIVRNEPSYGQIYEYITDYPAHWNKDILRESAPSYTLIEDLLLLNVKFNCINPNALKYKPNAVETKPN
ncbi:MAG TPA: hypothetical protein DCQ31_16200, partial [Bacteroidales bacterium]|nr:hypothetical protein [Bacteroidales bacterium]